MAQCGEAPAITERITASPGSNYLKLHYKTKLTNYEEKVLVTSYLDNKKLGVFVIISSLELLTIEITTLKLGATL
jgi:hypothetical protein